MKNKKYLFIIILSLIFLNGCFFDKKVKTVYIEKPVFVKCKIPKIPIANLKTIPNNATYPKKLEIILNNYLKLQKENELLRKAIETCQ